MESSVAAAFEIIKTEYMKATSNDTTLSECKEKEELRRQIASKRERLNEVKRLVSGER
ncbi:80 kDa MCM3-associated protein [Anopheles sinensis]|uniref:80 kDa MCM3-associated protein n=1 Tax=Anopheles sinensis TaxID=74873 RepID=A0A084WMW0_ANOSI|nr:80 kDa MCM3-associated protein [Anopheles sinensis]